MSTLSPLYNATINVAEITSRDSAGDPDGVGAVEPVDCRLNKTTTEKERGRNSNNVTDLIRITTQEYEFTDDTVIWLPGQNTADIAAGQVPARTGTSSTLNQSIYWAEI